MAVDVTPVPARLATRPIGTVLVTGGASGLGLAVADAVATEGGTPIILDRTESPSEHANLRVDLTNTRAAHDAITTLIAREPIDGVVTAAGVDSPGALLDVELDDWERI